MNVTLNTTSPLTNTSIFTTAGAYTILTSFAGDNNYTSGSKSHTITVPTGRGGGGGGSGGGGGGSGGGCTLNCAGKQCGDNGCGGSCGTCSAGYECINVSCIFIQEQNRSVIDIVKDYTSKEKRSYLFLIIFLIILSVAVIIVILLLIREYFSRKMKIDKNFKVKPDWLEKFLVKIRLKEPSSLLINTSFYKKI
jgi:hypothetical protein